MADFSSSQRMVYFLTIYIISTSVKQFSTVAKCQISDFLQLKTQPVNAIICEIGGEGKTILTLRLLNSETVDIYGI